MEKPYVSDVIDYYKDIEPYGFIQINAGVGSGKSTFVNQLIKGFTGKNEDGTEYAVPPKTVLLITSRRAKVNEILTDKNMSMGAYVLEWENGCPIDNIDEYLDSTKELPDLNDSGSSRIHQRSIACTNAAIENYLRNHFVPSEARTHLWRRFDYIVWDEAHSVLADASYQSAPFYVHKLLNRAYKAYLKEGNSCKVIIMTGSPKIISRFRFPKNGNQIDLMDRCKNVVPQTLSFVDTVEAKKGLLRRLENGERVIYFVNHVSTIFKIYEELSSELQAATAFSFSKADQFDLSDPDQKALHDRMKDTEKVIAEQQMLPDGIKLLLTTSRNKEGINIWNEDIKALYVENHTEADIIQMAGRVRNGVECLYIITDAGGFPNTENKWEYDFTADVIPINALEIPEEIDVGSSLKQLNLVEYINDYFQELCARHKIDLAEEWRKPTYGYEAAAKFIDFVHAKFPYVKYNYLSDEFALYRDKKDSIDYFDEQRERYHEAADNKELLTALARSWFENIPVIWPESIQSQIDRYFAENNLLNVPYDEAKREEIRMALGKILGKEVKQFKSTLLKYGYDELEGSKNKQASTYGLKWIVKK